MIGLDTNVLVRYFAQDDPAQSRRATEFIERECTKDEPGFVSLITLTELVWVNQSCYGGTKQMISNWVRALLSTEQLLVQDAETAWKALRLFESGQADFADCLVERIANTAGCTGVVTFDQKAARSGMTLLK